MAWPPGKHLEKLIKLTRGTLKNVQIIRHDVSHSRAIIDLEGEWTEYRIIISEIHRAKKGVRYAYYVLDQYNQVIYAFDNSPDNIAIKRRYGRTWKAHLHAEIPHQHDAAGNLTLTMEPMNFVMFMKWLQRNLPDSHAETGE